MFLTTLAIGKTCDITESHSDFWELLASKKRKLFGFNNNGCSTNLSLGLRENVVREDIYSTMKWIRKREYFSKTEVFKKKKKFFLQFVIVSLTGWGLLFYGGYKFFTEGKNGKKEEVLCSAFWFMIFVCFIFMVWFCLSHYPF